MSESTTIITSTTIQLQQHQHQPQQQQSINGNNSKPIQLQSNQMDFDDESCLVQLPNRTIGSGLSFQQQQILFQQQQLLLQQQLEREREARYKPPKLGSQYQCAEQPLLTEQGKIRT